MLMSCFSVLSKNLGHRAGGGKGEYYSHLPENSLSALEASLLELQYEKDFLYLEFDIQETIDGKVVIFHDKYIRRMISYEQNKEELDQIYKEIDASYLKRKFNRIKINELTYDQLMRLHLTDHPSEKVPTLQEFISLSKDYALVKPMTVELKYIHSKESKLEVIRMLKHFNDNYMKNADIIFEKEYDLPFRTGFLAWKSKFKKVFGKDPKWCQRVKEAGLHGVFKPGSHKNQCP